jgi:nickel transport protein
MIRLSCVAALAMLGLAPPALAHKLKVFAGAEGDAIVGSAYFAGGGAATDSPGVITGVDGREIARFRTDATGGFRAPVAARQSYRVAVDSGDGHVAEATVAAEELAPALPAAADVATAAPAPAPTGVPAEIEAAVARQILPLRRQIDAMEDRARFSDIMGGVGTIFGLCGIAAWWSAKRGKRP